VQTCALPIWITKGSVSQVFKAKAAGRRRSRERSAPRESPIVVVFEQRDQVLPLLGVLSILLGALAGEGQSRIGQNLPGDIREVQYGQARDRNVAAGAPQPCLGK